MSWHSSREASHTLIKLYLKRSLHLKISPESTSCSLNKRIIDAELFFRLWPHYSSRIFSKAYNTNSQNVICKWQRRYSYPCSRWYLLVYTKKLVSTNFIRWNIACIKKDLNCWSRWLHFECHGSLLCWFIIMMFQLQSIYLRQMLRTLKIGFNRKMFLWWMEDSETLNNSSKIWI